MKIIKNALLLDGNKVDIGITGSEISEISEEIRGDIYFDAKGALVVPGFVDLHTHLREPGREDSETVASGSMAAVRGGYTAISPMANTFPVADTAGVVEQVFSLGESVGLAAEAAHGHCTDLPPVKKKPA